MRLAAEHLGGVGHRHIIFDVGSGTVWVRHAYQFTIMRLVADRPVALTPRMVSRALTATTLPRDELLWQR